MTIARDRLARDTAALVQVPSVTGHERAALERMGELATALGLDAHLRRHDLDTLRAHPGHPGEEAERDELWGLTVTAPGDPGAGRLCLCGHLDVVGPGSGVWTLDPWSGAIADGFVHGRGSADMKGGTVAALHAMAAVRDHTDAEVVLLAVSSEEDGGLGAFAALEDDDRFDACLIPEPTGLDVVCAQAGALTFEGVVRGRGAHAAVRLEGRSAIDAYLPVHAALAEHERRINAAVDHALMAELELAYPVSVGRLAAGEWSSSVPDWLTFEGRLGVRVGEDPDRARAALTDALAGLVDELRFTGGQFASADTPVDHPFTRLVLPCFPGSRPVGAPYGADMRHFCAHGIPTVMVGPGGLERAHAVDERVSIEDLAQVAEGIARVLASFASRPRATITPRG